ncbi:MULTISPECIES: acyclic terpene utilization AtuA family protein [unclassified Imperialibacter]|uniref:acyclic terpene utilization AtuA family protein n=1 Tax=unclassified Imperialibacter TaxID=2629706 RepID=UPI001255DC00|nr:MULTISPECIES: acyclic terpene utilization AtuA family protein [unclassified Imperialibacter]CAD5257295.1 ABC transporter substrate-binding protein [Imperialibacter sp. 75]CAD5260170.1 ABC transporter substrate-binding protein [Imperialibacter sp. 89]VVT25729.1 ABC transporter substrate-binding protein [Imperialibacter sp. EC-SDR9]
MKKKIRIGGGAGFSGDRLEPAVVLAEKGRLDYLILECLAERTIALAQKRKHADPSKGYDPLLERRMRLLLPHLVKNEVRLITNMGAANPLAAADRVLEIAKELHLSVKVVAVTGDDVFAQIDPAQQAMETGRPLKEAGQLLSANAYIGIEAILPALQSGADIIVTGRVADPSLFLAPMVHEFGWKTDDYDLLGKGTVIGHLLECAGQITGGYFMDPGKKEVPDPAHLGFPFADVDADGSATISKVEGTGGAVNLMTAKEQLLYEVVNPHEYYTPDVIADFTSVKLKEIGKDMVQVSGGGGKARPATFKVSVGYQAFWLGEGEISYAGTNSLQKAKLAGQIVEERLKDRMDDLRVDYVGLNAIFRGAFDQQSEPAEVRLRVAGKAQTMEMAALVGEEVEALYTNGPAGGGGARKYVNEVVGIVSILMDRSKVKSYVTLKES